MLMAAKGNRAASCAPGVASQEETGPVVKAGSGF